MKLRRVRTLPWAERAALALLRAADDASDVAGPGPKAYGLGATAMSDIRRAIAAEGLGLLDRRAAFLHRDEARFLAIIAAHQRSLSFSPPATDPLARALRPVATAMLESGHRLSWRAPYEEVLLARGWTANTTAAEAARRSPPLATKRRHPSGHSLQGKLVALLRQNGRMSSAQIVAAGISRQYLSVLTAAGITARLGFNSYALGPNAPTD